MTLEQCKQLEKWGLPQMVKSGTSYWSKHIGRPQWLAAGIADREIGNEHDVDITDLEQLLEFANDRIHNSFGGENKYVEIHLPYDFYPQCLAKAVVGGRWGAPEYPVATDPDPKVAVYKLLEKILGEATP